MTGETEQAVSGWTVDTLKAHFDELRANDRRELERQAAEYERRLTDLNHAHEKQVEIQHNYLPRETWDGWLKEEQKRREKNDDEMGSLRVAASNAAARAQAAVATNARNLALASLVIAVVVLLANGRV